MIGEKIGQFYSRIEEKWYSLLEALQSRGIPVSVYNNFLEEHGLPSFPVTLGIIALILCLIFAFFLIGKGVSPQIEVKVQDQFGKSISGVMVTISANGEILMKKQVNGSDIISFEGIGVGTELIFEASKEGYENAVGNLIVNGEDAQVLLQLERVFSYIDGIVRLEDADSHDTISKASVFFEVDSIGSFPAIVNEEGLFVISGLPEGEEGLLKIKAENYEETEQVVTFQEGVMITVPLYKKIISLQGKTKLLINVIDAETKEPVSGAKIKIVNTTTNTIISEIIAEDGERLEYIDTGTSIKVIAEKEQYLKNESMPQTLVKEEENIVIELAKGGEKLTVILADEAGSILSEGIVQLYMEGVTDLTDEKVTGFEGKVEFIGLDPNVGYFVTGYKPGYVPVRKKVNVAEEEIVVLKLKLAHLENSAALNIIAVEEEGKAVNNASIQFLEIIGEELLPVGIPIIYTDETGFVQQYLPIGKKFLVRAVKEFLEGEAEKEIFKGTNELTIVLFKPSGVMTLTIVDEEGKPVTGTALITSTSGEVLFNGAIAENGEVTFDKKKNDTVKLKVTFPDGKTFSSEINVKDKDNVEVVASKSTAEFEPKLEFLGVFNDKDEAVEGIEKEKYYWLKFKAEFVKGDYTAGIHIRVGEDNVSLVDSQAIGIYGFDAASDDFFLGRTYTPEPAPGNEGIDRQNKGIAGKANKWLELYYVSPEDVEIIKVKVMALQTIAENEFTVKYRAWIDIENEFYRTPVDNVLGTAKYNEQRNALYADTLETKVKVFEAVLVKNSCDEGICLTYEFVNQKEERFNEEEFAPLTNRIYALELVLTSEDDLKPTVKVVTEKQNPAIGLISYQIDAFSFPEKGATMIEMQIPSIELKTGEEKRVRFYFKTNKAETTFLDVKIAAGDKIVEKKIYFNISQENTVELTISPENILVGEPFTIKVKDANTGAGITDATISLIDKEKKEVRAVVGNNSPNKGKNGEYRFASGLSPGYYIVRFSHPKYAPLEKPLFIAEQGLLVMGEEIKIEMRFNEKSKSHKEVIENKSKFIVKDLTYSFEEDDNWPKDLDVTITLPKTIGATEKNFVTVTANFKGKNEERVHGEGDLTVTGFIEGLFPVQLKARIKVFYNQPLPEECLTVNQKKIYVTMMGRGGMQEQVPLKVKNECEEELNIKPYAEGKKQDNALNISSPSFILKPGEEKEIIITISNSVNRMFSMMTPYMYNFYLQAAQLTKSIPLIVTIIDPSFALQTNDNIHIWLKKEEGKTGYSGSAPLYVMNVGAKPISNLRFNVMSSSSYINLQVYPNAMGMYSINPYSSQYYQSEPIYQETILNPTIPYSTPTYLPQNVQYFTQSQYANLGYRGYGNILAYGANGYPLSYGYELYGDTLMPGEQLIPPKTVLATTNASAEKIGGVHHMQIFIWGTINGKSYPLRVVNVFVHLSSEECLELTPLESMNFESAEIIEGTSIEKKVKVTNKCGEQVRALSLDKKQFGPNEMSISAGPNTIINPNASLELVLQLKKSGSYPARMEQISVRGLLVLSQQFTNSNKIDIKINIGKDAAKIDGPSTTEELIPVCGEEISGGTEKVSFPKHSTDDCTLGYCDAVNFSKWIAKKIELKLQQVQKRAYERAYELKNFPSCKGKAFCSFQDMGLLSETITAFLQHDFVSIDILKKEFSNYPLLKTFTLKYEEITPDEFSSAFYANQLAITKNLQGCGKYTLMIDGGMQIVGDKLAKDEIAVILYVMEHEPKTKQCVAEIENMLNFLPEDKGITAKQRYNTWAGMVSVQTAGLKEAEKNELIERGKDFAFALFANKDRMDGKETNNLELRFGEVKENGLLKLEIDYSRTGETEKRKIIATINDLYVQLAGEKTVQKKMMAEIAAAIKDIAKQKIEGCITKDKKAFVLKEMPKDLGKLFIRPEKKVLELMVGEKTCIDFNVQSNLKEKIFLKTNWEELKKEGAAGLEDVYLINNEGKRIVEYGKLASANELQEIELVENPSKKKMYEYQFFLCVKAHNENAEQALEKEVKVKAISGIRAKVESNWAIAKIKFCGLAPEEILSKISEAGKDLAPGQQKNVYFQTGWQKGEECIPLSQLAQYEAAKAAVTGEKRVIFAEGDTPAITKQKTVKEYLESLKDYRMAGYAGGCLVASLGCNTLTKIGSLPMILLSMATDCGVVPAMWAYNKIFPSTEAEKTAEQLALEAATKKEQLVKFIEAEEGIIGGGMEFGKQNLEGMLYGQAAKEGLILMKYIKGSWNTLTAGMVKGVSEDAAKGITDIFIKESFLDQSVVTTGLKDAIRKAHADELKNILAQQVGKKITPELIGEASKAATQAVASNPSTMAKIANELGTIYKINPGAFSPTMANAIEHSLKSINPMQVVDEIIASVEKQVTPALTELSEELTVPKGASSADIIKMRRNVASAFSRKAGVQAKAVAETAVKRMGLDPTTGTGKTLADDILKDLKKAITARRTISETVEYGVTKRTITISKDAMEAAVKQSLVSKISPSLQPGAGFTIKVGTKEVQLLGGESIEDALKRVAAEDALKAKNLAGEALEQSSKKVFKPGSISKLKGLFTKTAGKNLLKGAIKGLFCGVISNSLGALAASGVQKLAGKSGLPTEVQKENIDTKSEETVYDTDGNPIGTEQKDVMICRDKLYEVQMKKDKDGTLNYAIRPVDSIPIGAEILKSDCEGIFKKSNLPPDMSVCRLKAGFLEMPILQAYSQHCQEISTVMDEMKAKYPDTLYVNESLLATLSNIHTAFGFFTREKGAENNNMDWDGDNRVDYFAGCGASSKSGRESVKNDVMSDLRCAAEFMQANKAVMDGGKKLNKTAIDEYYEGLQSQYTYGAIDSKEKYANLVLNVYNKWFSTNGK